MPDDDARIDLPAPNRFAAIDRATRRVCLSRPPNQSARAAGDFPGRATAASPHPRTPPPTMDNQVFRDTYQDINERCCPYEKTILTNHGRCARARRFCIAEREGVECGSDAAQARCLGFLDLVRQRARFALKTADSGAALPHAKAMRVQVGGLRGVRVALAAASAQTTDAAPPVPRGGAEAAPIADIDGLLAAAVERFGALDALPFQPIVQQIAAFRGRRPLRGRAKR